ncbi:MULTISPECIES: arsenical pump-driving ATPase [Myroides]|uniref:arsenite-transporting ATPase n=1 Tax=Myroides odoratimimus TaxID=76832 RepID=A0AAI8C5K0_9FLAO|nr:MULTISPECIES: arsenical pump-driving ATPase [Myroides]ALU26573.1 arsenical pump-driving ATPase [Myroides odoratimimus]MDM1036946.1 arsenical pump-driving ATPase [Myroides odoratimimus]MDM1051980.1 arsenical pump-driving ATPase [Myroides odoratimimus]MDM1085976.1 arsenical pump-driving ATPase [Myroides odoratimimus]MDM1452467.1 arsenical pump-driving ATPase [Myroides odoratimimus]
MSNFKLYNPSNEGFTKYIFFTGKGGVGKTSIACATSLNLADSGKNILLISTDPASNLQDVFDIPLSNKVTKLKDIPTLSILNLNPEQAALEYKESIIGPYRGKLPEAVLFNMEEQLSGSCTVEIAAFNEFADVITNKEKHDLYDHIVFDTAPTGHTLRMLQLPAAWNTFIDENTTGVSCLGQLSGLGDRKVVYEQAVKTLSDKNNTTLFLVSRPDETPLKEVERSYKELLDLDIQSQRLIINGVLENFDQNDSISSKLYKRQQNALENRTKKLLDIPTYYVPLRSYNMTGIDNIRNMLISNTSAILTENSLDKNELQDIDVLIEDLFISKKKVVFTMGKGGVGKTTIAARIARGLVKKGVKVHLSTTDPANHLEYVNTKVEGLTVSHIDEKKVLEAYKEKVLAKARLTMGNSDLSYIEEDLRSPCTQEIAVFNAFAEIVAIADHEVIVIDTAPTGHTLLLLDSTQSYHKEVERTQGDISEAVQNLLPRLRNEQETEVVIVTLPETTPVFEAQRLQEDLARAGIHNKWWVINSSLYLTDTTSTFLKDKAKTEVQWINKVNELSKGNFVVIPWMEKVE